MKYLQQLGILFVVSPLSVPVSEMELDVISSSFLHFHLVHSLLKR